MTSPKYYSGDEWLKPFRTIIDERLEKCRQKEKSLAGDGSLGDFALGHLYYGLNHLSDGSWIFREWAPNATAIYLTGTFNSWQEKPEYEMKRINRQGDWEIILPPEQLRHGDLYKLSIHWKGGRGERIPSYATRLFQDDVTKIFSAQVWAPDKPYSWKIPDFIPEPAAPVIYEAHIGMATEECRTGTYREFTRDMLPYIAGAGYNTIQLMAVQEHPFYGSFGYHVSSFFAVSSRFGSPEELRELIDTAHSFGIRVIMDLIHSHSVKNINEGLGLFDGSPGQYFHTDERRVHAAWDSLCFNYGKDNVIHFLLSNCRYWIDEFKFDGFRFDGITSMIYYDHGLERNFTRYAEYFDGGQDVDALVYLYLANKMIHEIKPHALTVAEEMSGMPGMAAHTSAGGYGFDYRLSMGVPDFWIKLIKDVPDEKWDMGELMHELSQHRPEEKVISYCESHDQALVGDKTLIFRMIDAEMYTGMNKSHQSLTVDRAIALHKMIRLITLATAGGGYLTFMGNEFGHPEWIDFPREGNNWSYKYARRQWSLLKNESLKYVYLAAFDREMISLQKSYAILEHPVGRIYENSSDKIAAFTRGELLFIFNFHHEKSYTGYGIPVQGKFRIILDSDDAVFGGFNRIDRSSLYLSIRKAARQTLGTPYYLYLYLPSRTAIVLKREPVRKVSDI